MFSDEGEQLWVWQYETEDGKHDLFMDVGEEIRSVRKLKRALFTLSIYAYLNDGINRRGGLITLEWHLRHQVLKRWNLMQFSLSFPEQIDTQYLT